MKRTLALSLILAALLSPLHAAEWNSSTSGDQTVAENVTVTDTATVGNITFTGDSVVSGTGSIGGSTTTHYKVTMHYGSETSEKLYPEGTLLNNVALPVLDNDKVFLGWFREVRDENGDTTLKLMFQPDENGNVTLPHGYVMEHMVLIARFGKEGA